MKKVEFESADVLHNNWLKFTKKHNVNEDVDALSRLLESSHVAKTEDDVLDALYDSALAVLDATPQLESEQKTRAQYFSYNICTCNECQNECGAHINRKGQIRISQKFFKDTLSQEAPPPMGLLELMYSIIHQLLHAIFPELDEETINEKTEQTWKSGMTKLAKEKQN